MKKTFLFVFIALFLLLSNYSLTIKIGSIAPANSPWDKALKQMSREWKTISNGKIKLKIYPGGIAGSEQSMIRKIKIGTISGALLSNVGLSSIYPDFYVLNIPLLIRNDKEFDYVINGLKPIFEQNIEKQGYKIIIWSMAGWVRFFTKTPVFSPDDLKKQKLFFTTGKPIIEQSWKSAGFNTVPIELKDLMMALQSKMVNAFFMPPLIAASGQYFAFAPYMMEVKVLPVYGAVLVSKKQWYKVQKSLRDKLLNSARIIANKLDYETKKLEASAIQTMQEHGLIINKIKKQDLQKWTIESKKNINYLKEKLFSEYIYQKITALINAFRKKQKKISPNISTKI